MMKLSEFKEQLKSLESIDFILPHGDIVPPHFHITEVGKITKEFIDCGGTIRKENFVGFQLWSSHDLDHRLSPKKLIEIIEMAENQLTLEDVEIEVEYQNETIGKFGLELMEDKFFLISKQTACLAPDSCGVPIEKPKKQLKDSINTSACNPGSGCC